MVFGFHCENSLFDWRRIFFFFHNEENDVAVFILLNLNETTKTISSSKKSPLLRAIQIARIASYLFQKPWSIERFSNDCRKTKTKAITPTNDDRSRQRDEPITVPSNYL